MNKIELTDSVQDIIVKMADGNPGALTAMTQIMANSEKIDPQSDMRGLSSVLLLDTYEIYSTDIYVLWDNKCNRDVRRMIMLLRATQLGFFPYLKLQKMAGDRMQEIDLTNNEWLELDNKVCDRLDEFAKF